MTIEVQSEYRNLPLDSLTESPNNPRRSFDAAALNELGRVNQNARHSCAASRAARGPSLRDRCRSAALSCGATGWT